MRVGVLVEQLLAPVPGGVGRYSRELAAALARTATQDDTVSGWTAWHGRTDAARVPGVGGPSRLWLGRRALARAWRYGLGPAPCGCDVVHAPSPLAPPRRGRSLVVTVHDAVPWIHPQTLTPRGARWHREMVEAVVRSGATITTPTRSVAEELLDLLPGLDAERVVVLGAGVAPHLLVEPSPAERTRVRGRYALPDRFLFSVATLEPRKGLDVLIEALASAGDALPPLLVAGQPGWGDVDVPGAARAAGLAEGSVRLLGRVADDDLAVILRDALMLVAPSRAEGFGLPVAEAMAVGTPVVCSRIPALIEVAGDDAVSVPAGDPRALADALVDLVADRSRRERMRVSGPERARTHTWEAVARRAWALYARLAGAD